MSSFSEDTMLIPQIHITPRGLLIKARAADFPSLADFEPFIDLKPAGLAPSVAGTLDAFEPIGRAA
jgi:hypothetical protein